MANAVIPRKAPTQGGASSFIDFSVDTPALNGFANATGAACVQSGGAALCSMTGGAAGTHFGVKLEKVSGTWDLSDQCIAFDAEFLNAGAGNAGYGQKGIFPEMWLCMDSGTTFTNYVRFPNMGSSYNKIPGRMTILAPAGKFTTIGGTPNLKAVKRVEIRLQQQATAVQALHQVKIYKIYQRAMSRAKIMISFDDQYSTAYSAAMPYMAAFGWTGTMYAQANAAGASGRMTWTDLQSMADAGWTIGAHNLSHTPFVLPLTLSWSAGLVTATVSAAGVDHGLASGQLIPIVGAYEPEFNGMYQITVTGANTFTYPQAATPVNTTASGFPCIEWMNDAQIKTNVQGALIAVRKNLRGANVLPEIYSYANGAFSDLVVAQMAEAGVLSARTTSTGAFPGLGAFAYCTEAWNLNPYRLPSFQIGGSTTAAQILAAVDMAIQYGAALEIYGHQVGAGGDIAAVEFNAACDGIRARELSGYCDVINKRQFHRLF
jgi:hypothetical protein